MLLFVVLFCSGSVLPFENYVHDTLHISKKGVRSRLVVAGVILQMSQNGEKKERAFKKKGESELKPFSRFITVA
jgi:hypothetical protein